MKRFARVSISLLLLAIIIVTANQVWASPAKDGTVPTSPPIATYAPPPTVAPLPTSEETAEPYTTAMPTSVFPTVAPEALPTFGPTVAPGESVVGTVGEILNLGTVIVAPMDPNSSVTVTKALDVTTLVQPAVGEMFLGDTFMIVTVPADAPVQVCYAYPPEMASKEAEIKKLNTDKIPNIWEVIVGATITNGEICVITTMGQVSLIGDN